MCIFYLCAPSSRWTFLYIKITEKLIDLKIIEFCMPVYLPHASFIERLSVGDSAFFKLPFSYWLPSDRYKFLKQPLDHLNVNNENLNKKVRVTGTLQKSFLVGVVNGFNRSSHHRCSMKKGVFKNFTKFIGKHLCQSFLLW